MAGMTFSDAFEYIANSGIDTPKRFQDSFTVSGDRGELFALF
jgi:hypothetical protein